MALLSAALAAAGVALLLTGRRSAPRDRPGSARLPGPRGRGASARSSRPEALRLVATSGTVLAVLLLVPGMAGAAVSVAAAALVWWRSRHWESAALRRRRSRLEDDLPHTVDLMVAALTAGAAPGEALDRVSRVMAPPMSEELSVWVSQLRLGADPVTVWSAMDRHPQLGRLGTTLRRSAETGAPVTASLTRLAQDLRARHRADIHARVRQVEVKAAVPLGVCLLPSFVLVGVVPLVAGSAIGFLNR